MLQLNRDGEKKPKKLTPEEEIALLKEENNGLKADMAKTQEALDFILMSNM